MDVVTTRFNNLRSKKEIHPLTLPSAKLNLQRPYLCSADQTYMFLPEMYTDLSTTLQETFQKYSRTKQTSARFKKIVKLFQQEIKKDQRGEYFINYEREQIEFIPHTHNNYLKFSHYTLKNVNDFHLLRAPAKYMEEEPCKKVDVIKDNLENLCPESCDLGKWLNYWVAVLKSSFPEIICSGFYFVRFSLLNIMTKSIKWGKDKTVDKEKIVIINMQCLPKEFVERGKRIYFMLDTELDFFRNCELISDSIFGICMTKGFKHLSRMPLVDIHSFITHSNAEHILVKYPWKKKYVIRFNSDLFDDKNNLYTCCCREKKTIK